MVALLATTFLTSCGGGEKRIANIDSDGIELIMTDVKFDMIDPGSFDMYSLEITDTLDNEDVFKEFSDVEKVSLSTKLNTQFIKVYIKYRCANEQNGISIGSATGIVSKNNLGAVMQGSNNKTVRYMITGTTEKPKKKKNSEGGQNDGGDNTTLNMKVNMNQEDLDMEVNMEMEGPY